MKQINTRKLILSMEMSFDGIVTAENNEAAKETDAAEDQHVDNSDELWNYMFNDLQSVDTILAGAGMNPLYFDHWRGQLNNSTADSNEVKYARWAYQIPHIVFSKSQQTIDWPNSRIATDPDGEIAKLKQQPGKDILTWGGAAFANYLISKGLIDEYNIRVSPKILGRGKALFKNIQDRSSLSLIDVRQLKSGTVMLRYKA